MKFLKKEAQQPLSAKNVLFMIKRGLFCMQPFREIWYRNILLCSSLKGEQTPMRSIVSMTSMSYGSAFEDLSSGQMNVLTISDIYQNR
nr:putative transposase [Ipomoea batatas]